MWKSPVASIFCRDDLLVSDGKHVIFRKKKKIKITATVRSVALENSQNQRDQHSRILGSLTTNLASIRINCKIKFKIAFAN